MKKILVTGANGYIGSHVVKRLLDKKNIVIACDINTNNIDKRAVILRQDIFNITEENIFEILGEPDVCIHLAWKDGFNHNSPSHISLLSKHYNFIKNMVNYGLKHLVIMGTMHEIGYFEGKVDEDVSCNPLNLYGISKDTLRKSIFILSNEKKIKLQWLRAFYIYGDDGINNSIFSKILIAEKNKQEKFPFTTGKNKYDFISIEELSEQISKVALQDKILGIINCCSGKPVSLADKIENFILEKKLKIKLEYGAYPERVYDSPILYGENKKIISIMENKKDYME